MFPARAGMSLAANWESNSLSHVPRASGDEPATGRFAGFRNACSPRERG